MEKQKEYPIGDVTVVWKPGLCIHSANCVRSLPHVFKPMERPWIQMDDTTEGAVVQAVDKCPSGALSYFRKDAVEANTKAPSSSTIQVQVIENGPLIVMGDMEVTHVDGRVERKERRAAFCRCGKTGNYPYCDGTHKKG